MAARNLALPANIRAWASRPGLDGSWQCRVGLKREFEVAGDPSAGTLMLFWADDIGFAIDIDADVPNPVTGEHDDLYSVQIESLRVEHAIALHRALSEALDEYRRVEAGE